MSVLGVYRSQKRGKTQFHAIIPFERDAPVVTVPDVVARTLTPGDVVMVSTTGRRLKQQFQVLGALTDPNVLARIALLENGIVEDFTDAALMQAQQAQPATLASRDDLRALAFVTIDGEDAKDFDDAVWAAPDPEGGWHLKVAIADVAHYVPANTPLDDEAYLRGNSVYLPGFVVPMLPEALSNGLCSLQPNVERACICAHMRILANGELDASSLFFTRALIISKARLTYEQVQAFSEGTAPPSQELSTALDHLWGAYRSLLEARKARKTMDFDLQERKVVLDQQGQVIAVGYRQRLQSHQLIEEMMIAANVAAAIVLERAGMSFLYRVHEPPAAAKVEQLKSVLKILLPKVRYPEVWTPKSFMAILKAAEGTPFVQLVNSWVLRTQSQAHYTPVNKGHFGLNLQRYVHFTSPIRRYADLVVHRALVASVLSPASCAQDKQSQIVQRDRLAVIADHISITERQAAMAERATIDRMSALFMDQRFREQVLTARVTGVHRSGVFVTIDRLGVTGLIPVSYLSHEFLRVDERRQRLVGRGTEVGLGSSFEVVVNRVDLAKGWIDFVPLAKSEMVMDSKETSPKRHLHQKLRQARLESTPRRLKRKPPRKRPGRTIKRSK